MKNDGSGYEGSDTIRDLYLSQLNLAEWLRRGIFPGTYMEGATDEMTRHPDNENRRWRD